MENPESKQKNEITDSLEEVIRQAFYCLECGRCTGTCPIVELFPEQFNPHHILENVLINLDKVINEKGIWFCASCYKCNRLCPQGIELPDIFLKLRKIAVKENGLEKLKQAIEIIKEKVPFSASFIGVCFHHERIPLDQTIVDNIFKKIHVKKKTAKQPELKEKIAVIGSGPAGLVVAHDLRQKGYQLTVFESQPFAGGMLRECIPEYRLPIRIIETDINNLKEQGIEFKTNTTIGKDLTFNQLFEDGFEAIFVASGAHQSINLNIEGKNLSGIVSMLKFMRDLKNEKNKKPGNKIVVIGGGNTAMDVASTAIRFGSKEVTILYRRSREQMPADKNEIREAEDDGVKIIYLAAPKRFFGEKKINKIECYKLQLAEVDYSGRKRPVPIKNSEFIIEADQVIIAIGERPSISFLPEEIEINSDGAIIVDPNTMETSLPGVFAGGDVVHDSATVAEAIVSAKNAVIGIDNYLKSK